MFDQAAYIIFQALTIVTVAVVVVGYAAIDVALTKK